MNPFLLWIIRNPVTSTLLALCIALVIGFGIRSKQLSHSKEQLKEAKGHAAVLQANVDQLKAAVGRQNSAVDKAVKDGKAIAKDAERRAVEKLKPVAPKHYGAGAEELNKWASSLQ